MENKAISKALEEEWVSLTNKGYNVAFLSLYGSQNYGLDIDCPQYKSDIDFKAVIIPTLDDLINNTKPTSTVIESKNGQSDIKDIRVFTETLLKANPTYIETLYTPYYMVNPLYSKTFDELRALKTQLVNTMCCQFVRSMYGMMCEKEKAMCHPYPSIADKIALYGIDSKQVHHIYRLYIMMRDFIATGNVSFTPNQAECGELIKIKLNGYSLEEQKEKAKHYMVLAKELKENFINSIDESKIDYSVKDIITNLSRSVIKTSIEKDIRSRNE